MAPAKSVYKVCKQQARLTSVSSWKKLTPVGEGGSGRRPLLAQLLNILVGLTLELLSLYCIIGLGWNDWTVGCFIDASVACKVCFGISGQNIGFMKIGSETIN